MKGQIGKTLSRLVLGTLAIALLLAIVPAQAKAEPKAYDAYAVEVASGYLALRSSPADTDANIIGELYTGETVLVKNSESNKTFWYVYSPKLRKMGYVNKGFLKII